ncbi:MAG: extracellular solute-binding protein [Clostridia bacterium]|nr:extracellular solute-binding protein [Clostridia bacterium]
MKKTLNSLIYRCVPFVLAGAMVFSQVTVSAATLKEKYNALTEDEIIDYGVTETPRYSALRDGYAEKGYKPAEQTVSASSVIPTLGGDAKPVTIEDSEEGTVFEWCNKETSATWSFNVTTAGLYCIKFRYLLGEDGMAAVRSLRVDGLQITTETNKVSFYGLYKDDLSEGIKKNTLGDEIRPEQEYIRVWQDMYISDSIGVTAVPLYFYFDVGVHNITLDYISTEMYISEVALTPPDVCESYKDYISGSKAEAVDTVETIQAEEMLNKSHTTIRMESSYDPSCTPKSLTSIVMNTMGGSMWSKAGQTASWKIEVPEDGYYNLAMHVKQDFNQGMPVYRKIEIDGKVPFEEFAAYKFEYNTKWCLKYISDKEGNPYFVYLTKGEHTLSMTPVIGEMGELMNAVNDCTELLSDFLLQVMMITTSDPDLNYDYELEKQIPTIKDTINKLYEYQVYCIDSLNSLAEKRSSLTNSFNQLSDILELLKEDPENTVGKLTEMQTLLSSLTTTYISLQSQPLMIDSITYGDAQKFTEPKSNFFLRVYSVIANVILSFTKDYDNVKMLGDDTKAKEVISVWCGLGSEWAQIIKQLSDETFTPETGIAVDMNILPSGQLSAGSVNALMLAIAAGTAPDAAIGVAESSPGEFAMREAVVDLSKMKDYDKVVSELVPNSTIAMSFEGGVYGLPLTTGFKVMFYRKDIFQKFGFELPNSWNDVYDTLLPMLYQNNLQMYIPNDFGMFLAQYGGKYYTDDFSASALDSNEAFQAFVMSTELYTNYGIDVSASFYNRFRTGEMPIGIGGFSDYMSLQVAAPELTGKWAITLVPGLEKEDGTIDRSYMGVTTSSGIILNKSEKKDASWEFLKWYISEETQYQYDLLVEASIGQDSRVSTANMKALVRLPWDANDLNVILESYKWVKDTPAVLGGYFTSRHMSNAWNRVVMNSYPLRASLEMAIEEINKEITAKRKEYGRE